MATVMSSVLLYYYYYYCMANGSGAIVIWINKVKEHPSYTKKAITLVVKVVRT